MGKYLKIFEVKITFCESIFVFVVKLRNIGKMLKILFDFIDDIIHIGCCYIIYKYLMLFFFADYVD